MVTLYVAKYSMRGTMVHTSIQHPTHTQYPTHSGTQVSPRVMPMAGGRGVKGEGCEGRGGVRGGIKGEGV